jgi:hypothetical protein
MDFYIREYILQSPLRYGDKKVVWLFLFCGVFWKKEEGPGGLSIKEGNGREKSVFMCVFLVGWLCLGWCLECNIMYDYLWAFGA